MFKLIVGNEEFSEEFWVNRCEKSTPSVAALMTHGTHNKEFVKVFCDEKKDKSVLLPFSEQDFKSIFNIAASNNVIRVDLTDTKIFEAKTAILDNKLEEFICNKRYNRYMLNE